MPSGYSKHPQVMYEVKTVPSVQLAVQFAAQHNIRFSVVNSEHDFLGRKDAPSGILLDVSGLKGAHLLESYTPMTQGTRPVSYQTQTNQITYQPGAAVIFGGGMSTAELNNELGKSGLWTVGAAHGEVTIAGGWPWHSYASIWTWCR
jgi:FAD/FMN-containing dehydrogenase